MTSNQSHPPHRERGIALVVTLWVVALAALLVSTLNVSVRSSVSVTSAELRQSEAEALLDAGLEYAVALLIPQNPGRQRIADGTERSFAMGAARLSVSISDPNGLIDLNLASRDLLLSFFSRFTASEAEAATYVDAITRFRKEADRAAPTGGTEEAEEDEREDASAARPFSHVAQVRDATGISADLYRAVAPYLTVYGRSGRINPLTAPRAVLSSVPNVSSLDVDAALKAREAGWGTDSIRRQLDKGTRFLETSAGPAFLIRVALRHPDRQQAIVRQYVILMDHDERAPYRLLSAEPPEFIP